MQEYVGGFFVVILVLFLAILAPMQQQSAQFNSSVQTIVAEDVNSFVDQVRSQGYITGQDYRNFLNTLEKTGNVYEITITVLSETYYPSDNGLKYEAVYIPDSQIEIVDQLGELSVDDIYSMKNGDYITVTVKQANVSLATRLSNLILTTSYSPEIYYSYGGGVGNEAA